MIARYALQRNAEDSQKYEFICARWELGLERPTLRENADYGECKFLELWIPWAYAEQHWLSLLSGLILDQIGMQIPIISRLEDLPEFEEEHDSGRHFHGLTNGAMGSLSGWHELVRCFKLIPESSRRLTHYNKLLTGRGIKPYSNFYQGIMEWVWPELVDDYQRRQQKWFHSRFIFIRPEFSIRVESVYWKNQTLSVTLNRKETPNQVELQVLFEGKISLAPVLRTVKRDEALLEIAIPENTDTVEIILLDAEMNRLLSHLRLNNPGDAFEADRKVILSIERAAVDVAAGENQEVEFKTFNDFGKKDTRKALLSTVVAFANQERGKIYIGVTDHGEIQDIEDARQSLQQQGSNEVIYQALKERIENLVYETVLPRPDMVILQQTIDNKTVLVIQFGAQPRGPFSVDKKIYIRKGSTDRIIDPQHELSELLGKYNRGSEE